MLSALLLASEKLLATKERVGLLAIVGVILTALKVPADRQAAVYYVIGSIASALMLAHAWLGRLAQIQVKTGDSQGAAAVNALIDFLNVHGDALKELAAARDKPPADQSGLLERVQTALKNGSTPAASEEPVEPVQPVEPVVVDPGPVQRTLGWSTLFGSGALASLLVGVTLLGGCTSMAFKVGANSAGPLLADRTSAYVNADVSLSAADKAVDLAAATQLKTATATLKSIGLAPVQAAWTAVKPLYAHYITTDANLAPDEVNLRNGTAAALDSLLDAESQRQSSLLKFLNPFSAPPIAQPSSAARPATQPAGG